MRRTEFTSLTNMNTNMQFEFGFYTPGTMKGRLIEATNAIKDGKAPKLNKKVLRKCSDRHYNNKNPKFYWEDNEPEKPKEPVVSRPEHNKITISRPGEIEKNHVRAPIVTLPRKNEILIKGPSVLIHHYVDKKEAIETRKRELLIREKFSEDKSVEQHRWNQALIDALEADAACL